MLLNKKKPLGMILADMGLITEEKLMTVLNRAEDREMPLGEYLIKNRMITTEDLAKCMASQSGLEYLPPQKVVPEKDVIELIPKSLCEELSILPIRKEDKTLVIGVLDASISVKLQEAVTVPFKLMIISSDAFKLGFSKAYEKEENIKQILKKITDEKKVVAAESRIEKSSAPQSTSVEKLVNDFIEEAVKSKASDIHIEADDELLRVRIRIDGVLIERETFPLELHSTIISRVKLVAGLDITEKRIPQDGRIHIKVGTQEIDLRVSTLPTIKGEKAVLRILDKESINVDINTLGIAPAVLKQTKEILAASNGIILVTGPTGSGKTTTVYSMLNYINTMDINIITVEDPVEYHFKLINQVQVNTKANLTFASSLRSILRQDPDVIMIGEIRDAETAEIAIKAALTGHLVVSTLHTNDAISTIQRLIDIGVEPYLVSSAILGVVAQRLVRKVCPHCMQEISDIKQATNEFDEAIIREGGKGIKAVGCEECFHTGYKGRLPVFELFVPDVKMRLAIKDQVSDTEMTKMAIEKLGFVTMAQDGMIKIKEKLTTADEVMKQIGGLKKS